MAPPGEYYASEQQIQDRANALLERWNALQNAAFGPSVNPRPDVSPKLQDQIFKDRQRYRKFVTRPMFLPGDYSTTLRKWYSKYALRAKQLAAELGSLPPAARPQQLPRQLTSDDALASLKRGAMGVSTGLVVGAAAWVWLTSRGGKNGG